MPSCPEDAAVEVEASSSVLFMRPTRESPKSVNCTTGRSLESHVLERHVTAEHLASRFFHLEVQRLRSDRARLE